MPCMQNQLNTSSVMSIHDAAGCRVLLLSPRMAHSKRWKLCKYGSNIYFRAALELVTVTRPYGPAGSKCYAYSYTQISSISFVIYNPKASTRGLDRPQGALRILDSEFIIISRKFATLVSIISEGELVLCPVFVFRMLTVSSHQCHLLRRLLVSRK